MKNWGAMRGGFLGRGPRTIAAAILLAGFAACLALNLPGQLSYDSIAQLHDGRFGVYNAWHPPIMAWLLGLADSAVRGTSLFVIFDAVLLYGSLTSVLWLAPRVNRLAPAIALALVLLPQLVLYQGIVWKDVLFADCAIAGFVLIAHAGMRWSRSGLRNALLAAGLVMLVLATLARQNGPIVLVFGIAAIGVLAAVRMPAARFRAMLAFGGMAALLAFCLWAAATVGLAMRTPGESGSRAQLKLLELYDLIGAVKREPALELAQLEKTNPDLVDSIRTDGVRLYTPQRNDTLVGSAALQDELSDTPSDAIFVQWRALVVGHPLLYLSVRADVFAWTLLTPDISRCSPLFVGVQGLPRYMHDLHLTIRDRPQDEMARTYGNLFVGTPLLSHAVYALLNLACLVLLLRRRTSADLVMALLLASALAFSLSFFVISIACDYRYLLFLDLSALLAAFHLAAVAPKMPEGDGSSAGQSGLAP